MVSFLSKNGLIDIVIEFHFDALGKCYFEDNESITPTLGKAKISFLRSSLNQTSKIIKKDYPELYSSLIGRKFRLRISRANHDYAYDMPVFIIDGTGKLTRRAGWDGLSDEWYDSFMVNMRDYNNIQFLSEYRIP